MLEERYDRLLREHGAALRRVAASYEADSSRRDDLFQDICLALWRALPSFRGESSERTFAFRIAHNRGLSHGWRQGRKNLIEGTPIASGADGASEEDPRLADERWDPEAATLAVDRRRRLRAAVRSLPLGPRQVLTLTLEGLPQREIAEVLGISEGNVAVRVHRARKALRRALEGLERGAETRSEP